MDAIVSIVLFFVLLSLLLRMNLGVDNCCGTEINESFHSAIPSGAGAGIVCQITDGSGLMSMQIRPDIYGQITVNMYAIEKNDCDTASCYLYLVKHDNNVFTIRSLDGQYMLSINNVSASDGFRLVKVHSGSSLNENCGSLCEFQLIPTQNGNWMIQSGDLTGKMILVNKTYGLTNNNGVAGLMSPMPIHMSYENDNELYHPRDAEFQIHTVEIPPSILA